MDRRVVCGVCGYAIHGVAEQQHGDHPPHSPAEIAALTDTVDRIAGRLAFVMYLRLWHDGPNQTAARSGRPLASV